MMKGSVGVRWMISDYIGSRPVEPFRQNRRPADDRTGLRGFLVRHVFQGGHTSRIYETEPVDYKDQAWFLNQVVEAETALFPMQLLTRIGRVEREMGRLRTVRKGPRTIDIDILFYAAAVVETARLEIPHPRIAERRFVLAPLAELAPDLRHPVT